MPTGYTAMLQDNPDVPFADFAKQCARAFGACIMQRDDPHDALPDPNEQPSRYHVEELEELRSRLAWLGEASDVDLLAEQDKAIADHVRSCKEGIEKKKQIEANYRRMLALAEAWEPPTPDHRGLKEFMVKQITESIDWDCDTSYWDSKELRVLTAADYRSQQIKEVADDIEYHEKQNREEVDRCNQRNEWKRQLFASLESH